MERVDAIYARQSIDKIDSISIESQIEFCSYESRGAPYRVFQDKGYSGKNIQRPQFQQMLAAIRAGQIKRVICYKLDRCSRSILDFAGLMEEFQKYDVEFVSCTEKFDTSTPMGRAMLNVCIVFAQLERETIQQRVQDAYHARSKKGFYMGGRVPFGFRLEPILLEGKKTSRYVVNEQEAEILAFAYARYACPTTSLSDVVNALKEAGIVHPRRVDGRWDRTHIGRMLYNPIYVKADSNVFDYFYDCGVTIHNLVEDFTGTNGCYLYSEKSSGSEAKRHLVLAPHCGIISSDIWLKCRKKRKKAEIPVRQYKIKNTWLAGKIKCGKCGYALVVQKTTKQSGKTFRYIVCSQKHCSGIHGVKADELEELVWVEMEKILSQLHLAGDSAQNPEILGVQKKLVEIQQKIDNASAKALEATGPLMEYLCDTVARLEEEKRQCRERLRLLKARNACQQQSINADYASIWHNLPLEEKILVTDALIDKITLSESEVTIYWKF